MFILKISSDKKVVSYRTGTLRDYNAIVDRDDVVYIDRSHFNRTTYDVSYFVNNWYDFFIDTDGVLTPKIK
jgi:hypothetical protein